jgi:uncharacterized protein (DUF1330 family)
MSALFIAVSKVTDREKLNQYLAGAPASLAGRQIEILAFTEAAEAVEGAPPGSRVVVLRFPDADAAMDWYRSAEYQAVVQLRLDGTEGFALLCDGM